MDKPSTENLNLLASPAKFQSLCKSISTLEAIICPEWEFRHYSYQKDWSATEEFCEMRNGQGDQVLILFNSSGICINGFAHKSEFNGWKTIQVKEDKSFIKKLFDPKKEPITKQVQEIETGILSNLPKAFQEFILGEPASSIGTTFCIWNIQNENNWKVGEINFPKNNYKDGSSHLLELLDGNPTTYKKWAEEYYEEEFDNKELNLKAVESIYSGTPINKELVLDINPAFEDFDQLKIDLNEIGYRHNL